MNVEQQRALFQEGVRLFNEGEFYDCHEVLEELWTFTQQPDRWFLQALIHFAVACYHHERGNRVGATRQLRRGLLKFRGYLPQWDGVETGLLADHMEAGLKAVEAGRRWRPNGRVVQSEPWPGLRSPLRK